MDRRSFLAGMLGLAGVSAVIAAKPAAALAGVPNRPGILDDLETAQAVGEGLPDVEMVRSSGGNRRHDRHRHHHHRHGRRRQEWRTVCRRYRRNGRWRKRCRRELVWVRF